MPNKNMQNLISALKLLGVIRPESLQINAEVSSYQHPENEQEQRIQYQREQQNRHHYNYDDNAHQQAGEGS